MHQTEKPLANSLGWVVLQIGAILESKHLLSAVIQKFDGCECIGDILARYRGFDPTTEAGIVFQTMIAIVLISSVAGGYVPTIRVLVRRVSRHDTSRAKGCSSAMTSGQEIKEI